MDRTHFSDAMAYFTKFYFNKKESSYSSFDEATGERFHNNVRTSFLKPGYKIIHMPEDKWPKPLENHIEMEDAVILGTCTYTQTVNGDVQEVWWMNSGV